MNTQFPARKLNVVHGARGGKVELRFAFRLAGHDMVHRHVAIVDAAEGVSHERRIQLVASALMGFRENLDTNISVYHAAP